MNNRKGFGLIGMIITLIIIMFLVAGKTGYLDRWLGNKNSKKKPNAPSAAHQLSGGYVETQIGIGENAKAQVRDIQKTLSDRYKQ